ncbi:MAG TPA: prepilin-type N-terminal cleavage/methylation domain-containing protein [Candidatus Binatia bacterium]|nr:prepilin-type N-terminal cleavage/methylation domain-containing protein [Candidatus Binatia bacterium]
MRRTGKHNRGFSLMELLFSAALGMVMVTAAADVYSRALKASTITTQKAEMQQDFRAAANILQRDISMAGAGALGQQGLSSNVVGLVYGTGTLPVYPCTGVTTCSYISGAPVAYPTTSGVPYFYSIIPGPSLGITVNAASGPTDIITINSADPSLALNCYTGTMDSTGTIATFQLAAVLPATCVLPTGIVTPPALNAAYVGLQVGDMIMFGIKAIGVVTGTPTTCAPTGGNVSCFTVTFAATDPGHINQPTATTGSLKQFASAALPSAVRLLSVTYYLDISPADGVTPRLMRIQSGQKPAPVAENVVFLKFTYDVDNGGTISTNLASLPAGTSPNMIMKVNIAHMSMRSQDNVYGGYQSLDLQTSISARNLSMQQEYPITGSAY